MLTATSGLATLRAHYTGETRDLMRILLNATSAAEANLALEVLKDVGSRQGTCRRLQPARGALRVAVLPVRDVGGRGDPGKGGGSRAPHRRHGKGAARRHRARRHHRRQPRPRHHHQMQRREVLLELGPGHRRLRQRRDPGHAAGKRPPAARRDRPGDGDGHRVQPEVLPVTGRLAPRVRVGRLRRTWRPLLAPIRLSRPGIALPISPPGTSRRSQPGRERRAPHPADEPPLRRAPRRSSPLRNRPARISAKRGLAVTGRQIDRTHAVADHHHPQPECDTVERRVLHAVVGRQTDEPDLIDARSLQLGAHPGVAQMPVVEEAAVAVDLGVHALADHDVDAGHIKPGVKRRTGRLLNAVVGPEHLLVPGEFDDITRRAARMVRSEGAVGGGMPVLGRDHHVEPRCERVRDRDDSVSIGDGQRPERHEVVLDVDHQQGAHPAQLLCCVVLASAISWRRRAESWASSPTL